MDLSVFAADLKVFPLSDTILLGRPRRAAKRLKQRRNDWADKLGTTSRCIALTMQHVYIQIQTFSLLAGVVVLIYSRPAKSTLVYVNGGSS